ncbi:hypothetical protein HanXRQr2_Chr11g0489841 [Helianthus annuus]|uniref:Uncharacterized protein n=1 Tax=Helianthus annuus TaxID=4232 RepID=A0A9K3HPS0_HELAN|nr:hypothetical protein HanXRQr2_Chr11g0489841 [Helianthus annuus]KAJ0875094.1 hypothetical protein HanPSC8_Chr11g0472141 [Helianthus annuus]
MMSGCIYYTLQGITFKERPAKYKVAPINGIDCVLCTFTITICNAFDGSYITITADKSEGLIRFRNDLRCDNFKVVVDFEKFRTRDGRADLHLSISHIHYIYAGF